ncbi:hypothetical protein L596_021219 [Steinernema carpocapsae]|uniref:Uncharacterized protein n=1 Tax=Steinernema carpocapsae TaxID=34508 RepID=A0A4U5MW61_STECR|nr:hypothetical protein L596_021219 [Steinernema carpocapsae]
MYSLQGNTERAHPPSNLDLDLTMAREYKYNRGRDQAARYFLSTSYHLGAFGHRPLLRVIDGWKRAGIESLSNFAKLANDYVVFDNEEQYNVTWKSVDQWLTCTKDEVLSAISSLTTRGYTLTTVLDEFAAREADGISLQWLVQVGYTFANDVSVTQTHFDRLEDILQASAVVMGRPKGPSRNRTDEDNEWMRDAIIAIRYNQLMYVSLIHFHSVLFQFSLRDALPDGCVLREVIIPDEVLDAGPVAPAPSRRTHRATRRSNRHETERLSSNNTPPRSNNGERNGAHPHATPVYAPHNSVEPQPHPPATAASNDNLINTPPRSNDGERNSTLPPASPVYAPHNSVEPQPHPPATAASNNNLITVDCNGKKVYTVL